MFYIAHAPLALFTVIGRTISHYRIVDRLGEGGMGVVYRAEDLKLGRQVAMKFLRSGASVTDESHERFVIEARAAAALNHPNIATIHGIGEDGDVTYIVMELVEGRTLRSMVEDGSLDRENVVELAIQIGEGLAAAHAKGITHRDIKSANIMVLPDGRAKILDFGLARIDGGTMVTTAGTSMGTIAYMSPEQARGESVDQRTDVWAFGVVLYEMLTGRMPFQGAYEQSVMYAIFNEEPKALERELEDAFGPITSKLLAKSVGDRYASMNDVIADLKAVRDGRVASVTPVKVDSGEASASSTTIAVLPFVDMSREQDQEYFCDGITEELIDALSQAGDWRVVARTSSFAFKKREFDVREVGQRLGATHLLEGSLRKMGNRVRATTRLTSVGDALQIWSEKYDGEVDDIFQIQDAIAGSVLEKLKVSFGDDRKERPARRSTDSIDAYDLYLKARFHINKRTDADLRKAVSYCERAIDSDADFAQAHAGLADALVLLAVQGGEDPTEAMARARVQAETAIDLDAALAEAHTSLATIRAAYDWNRTAAEESYRCAIDLNPSYGTARHWFGLWCLVPEARFEEALQQLTAAAEVDPLSLALEAGIGWIHYLSGYYDEAEARLEALLTRHPDFVMARDLLGQTLVCTDKLDAAIEHLEQSVRLSERRSLSLALLAYAYGIANRTGEALTLRYELESRATTTYVSPYDLALTQCGLNEGPSAIRHLERAVAQRNPWVLFLGVDPLWTPLRSEDGFGRLMERIGLDASNQRA